MRTAITGDDIYATIVMLRTVDDRAVVLLEGDDDVDCLVHHVDEESANCIPCHGSSNLDRAIALADADGVARVLAIRDLDWVDVLTPRSASPNVVYTDLYDLDATVLGLTEIGSKIGYTFGIRDRVHEFLEVTGHDSPLEVAVQIGACVGLLRLASERSELGINTRDFPIHEAYGTSSSLIDRQVLIAIAIRRTANCTIEPESVIALVENERASEFPDLRVCSGRDLGSAFVTLCKREWGASSSLGVNFFLKAARLALSCDQLSKLKLFHRVVEWEERSGSRIWSCPRAA